MKGLLFFVKFSWRLRKTYLFLIITNQLLCGTLPLVIMSIPKLIIDEFLKSDSDFSIIVIYSFLLFLSSFLLNWGGGHLTLKIYIERCYLSAQFGEYMHKKLMHADYINLDNPDFFDIKEKANKFLYGEGNGFSYIFEKSMSMIGKIITCIGTIAIMVSMGSWTVFVIIIVLIIGSFIEFFLKKKAHRFNLEAANTERRWGYFSRILENPEYAKEIRLNQIDDWIIGEEKKHAFGAIEFYKKRNSFFSKSLLLENSIDFMCYIFTYIYFSYEVIIGLFTVGSFTLFVNALPVLTISLKELLNCFFEIRIYNMYYDALVKYLNIEDTMYSNEKLPISSNDNYEIEFSNVSFKYPGQEKYAIKNINIVIRPGVKLAIVGENGSGKTTFIKLLCRFYDPTEGNIFLNGTNIKKIDYYQYQKIIAAVFQDYKLFDFSIKENIIWNDSSQELNSFVLNILKSLGLKNKIEGLAKGICTTVHKEFDDNGYEPSGGEAQKIAIARAIAKNARIIVLDEPLSSLDPKAEYEILKHYKGLLKNKTSIVVSHRLSFCSECDQIAVFKNGSICEFGTHNELMERKGNYYFLYSLQADLYR